MYGFGILLLEMFIGRRPTDDIFQDGLTLHDFVKTSLSEPVMEIMDPHLVFGDGKDRQMEEYVASLLRIGITCSNSKTTIQHKFITLVLKQYHKINFPTYKINEFKKLHYS